MPNIITPFGFVKKTGDTMSGDLDLVLNKLYLTDGEKGGSVGGVSTVSDTVAILKANGGYWGNLKLGVAELTSNLIMAAGMTVDGVDVSEIGKPSGKLFLGTTQENLVDGVITDVELDTIPGAYTDGIENTGTHEITPGVAGFYSIVGQVMFWNVVADKDYEAILKVSGAVVCRNLIHASKTGSIGVPVSLPNHYFTAANFLELAACSHSGDNTVDINPGETWTFLAVQRVR